MASGVTGAIGGSVLAAATHGIAMGTDRMLRASEQLVTAIDPGTIVDAKLGRVQVLASAELVRVHDELVGTLVDTLA